MASMTRDPTKLRIFQAARALFDQEGAGGLSMRRIAKEIGLTPMAIYKHYADKDALLNALMLDGLAAWEARVTAITARAPLAWLEQVTEAYLEFALTDPGRYEAAFLLRASAARQYPQDFAAGRSPVIRMAQARVEQARAAGQLGGDPSADVMLSLSALLQGLVSMYRAGRFADEARFRDAYRRAAAHCLQSFTTAGCP
jgi:AcrR family transcriptional regulator